MLIQLDQSALRKLLLDELKIEETEPEAIMKELKRTSAKTIVKALKNTVSVCSLFSSIDAKNVILPWFKKTQLGLS